MNLLNMVFFFFLKFIKIIFIPFGIHEKKQPHIFFVLPCRDG
jgi:hypothetical protein